VDALGSMGETAMVGDGDECVQEIKIKPLHETFIS
jgi:hypothetical protein